MVRPEVFFFISLFSTNFLANQNHNKIALHTHSEGYHFLKNKITNIDKDVDKLKPSYTSGGDVK